MDYQNILQNAFVNTIISLIAGALISYIFYRRSFVGARLVYLTTNLKLIGKDNAHIPSDVSILYKGEVVSRLTKTIVVV